MTLTPRRQSPKRRTIDNIRQDLASAVKALHEHAVQEGVLRQQSKISKTIKFLNAEDLKAEAEYCAELERLILKHFNSAVRKLESEKES